MYSFAMPGRFAPQVKAPCTGGRPRRAEIDAAMPQDFELFCVSLALNKPWLRVRHRLPGRLRLGVEGPTDGLCERLQGRAGITQVVANPQTQSLLVHYDGPELPVLRAIYQALPQRPLSLAPPAIEKPIRETYNTLDQGVRRLTHNWLDLRTGLALGVGLFALGKRSRAPFLLWSYAVLQQVARE